MRSLSLACAITFSLLTATSLTPLKAADMTYERALNVAKEPNNWLLHHGNFEGHRFSQLKDVNTDSVKNLKMVFSVALGGFESGGFDEAFFLYSEELDLLRRLADQGGETWFDPAAGAVHLWGGVTSNDPGPAYREQLMADGTGTITMTGTLPATECEVLVATVRGVPGVTEVINLLDTSDKTNPVSKGQSQSATSQR